MTPLRQITVAGEDVFHVAARELGDATQGIRILQLNGLVDAYISDPMTIVLPPLDASATGGVPAQ